MVITMAGLAAIIGLAAVGAEIRRRLMNRARISRRLAGMQGPKTDHFQFHATILPGMAKDADLA